jgi:hypothetical protein
VWRRLPVGDPVPGLHHGGGDLQLAGDHPVRHSFSSLHTALHLVDEGVHEALDGACGKLLVCGGVEEGVCDGVGRGQGVRQRGAEG